MLSGGADVGRGGRPDADGDRQRPRPAAVCSGSGLSEANPDSLQFEFTIEGTVEGPLRDAGQTGEDAPTTDQPEPADLSRSGSCC